MASINGLIGFAGKAAYNSAKHGLLGLIKVSATKLGATVLQAALEQANIAPDLVEEIIMGNVLQAGLGQNPDRQASLLAGLPETVPTMTINKV